MKGKAAKATELVATLVRLNGMSVDLSGDSRKLPSRMKVLAWGENPNARRKRVFVGPRFAVALASPLYPYRKAPLDFEHNTLPGTPAYTESVEPRSIAGYTAVQVIEGDGVYITMLNWTPAGLDNAANYCDLSAAAVTDQDGEVLAIPSVALCRCGAVEGMDFLDVPLSADQVAVLSAALPNISQTQNGGSKLNWRDIIAEALGMDPKIVSDEDLSKALKAALTKTTETTTEALNAAIDKAVSTALKPVSDQVVALSASEKAFKGELEKRDKAAILDAAGRDGKVVALSAEAIGKLSVADLQAHTDALPVTVPLTARTPTHIKESATQAGPSDAQRAIALNCGMDAEKVFAKKESK
jgi:hypothetical protein